VGSGAVEQCGSGQQDSESKGASRFMNHSSLKLTSVTEAQ
jgi:hypothetical protein